MYVNNICIKDGGDGAPALAQIDGEKLFSKSTLDTDKSHPQKEEKSQGVALAGPGASTG